ncbi:MATE family efflux transporter [Lactobacillus mulieris]|jgi:MATE efflux family protein|uniref:Multidrug export protein MepA n=1 Tax=Lactobacillus mulieris TaxID=2508708 RepID=A0AAP3M567_9LACO|nr:MULTISPECIES: MATE family efflux transporter [Lactobacillus]EEU20735.1 MATE efflux family protein [Lactobacillus jensenii 27-2-CHN]EEX23730.1 MATE efflux family protein [Lactobacillus jensenii 115-3-CHN]EFH29864.1 MATE efflux family protein [Lactobacillus jensenii JV-V16]KAA9243351.1 MATE family efflux transporter [Lactobacillus jensenii]KAA9361584.1 MATE family efflux transporter [Lactobacillus jensenii]
MNTLFAKAPIKQVYFKLAFPVVLGMITTMVYNLVDTMFVAKTGDANLVAAVTISTPLINFLIAFSDILGLGGSSVISRLFGEKKYEEARRVSSFSIYAGIITSFILTAILFVFEKQILWLFGARASTYADAAEFYRVLAIGAVFIMCSLIPQNLLRTEGLAVEAMIGSISGTVVAIILDPVFLFVLKMGATGVATANIIGFIVTDSVLFYYMIKRAKFINAKVKFMKVKSHLFNEVIAIGIPSSVNQFANTFGMALLNSTLAAYGAKEVAAMGITQKIYSIVILAIVGFTFGSQPLIGFNYGAKNWQRLKEVLRFDIFVQVVYAIVSALILIVFAHQIVGLFMNDSLIINSGSYMLLATLITTPLAGIIMVYTTVFQSIGNAWGALIMSLARQGIVYLLAMIVLQRFLGLHGIVWAQAASDVITFTIGYVIFSKSLNLKAKIMKEQNNN